MTKTKSLVSGWFLYFWQLKINRGMDFLKIYHKIKDECIGSDLTINNIDDADKFHDRFIEFRSELYRHGIIDSMPHYRGEQKYGWDIISGIFRPPLAIQVSVQGKSLEEKAINEFERVILEKVGPHALRTIYNKHKYGRQWDLLFQAQHAGIKTTLTDWSAYISSALYFATEKSDDSNVDNADGQLWCLMIPTDMILGDKIYELDPFNMDATYLINPSSFITDIEKRIFEYRMYHQKGRFVIPSNDLCNVPLNRHPEIIEFLIRLRIPASQKPIIRGELFRRRVTREYFFVDENPQSQYLISEINRAIFPV